MAEAVAEPLLDVVHEVPANVLHNPDSLGIGRTHGPPRLQVAPPWSLSSQRAQESQAIFPDDVLEDSNHHHTHLLLLPQLVLNSASHPSRCH
ncbi:hypothetical protein ACG7TL_007488 [Trametes sanguinea]